MTNESPPFITALKTGGTKEEAIFAMERMWEDHYDIIKMANEMQTEIVRLHEKLDQFVIKGENVDDLEHANVALRTQIEELQHEIMASRKESHELRAALVKATGSLKATISLLEWISDPDFNEIPPSMFDNMIIEHRRNLEIGRSVLSMIEKP